MFQVNTTEQFINFYEKVTSISYNYGQILNSLCCDISNENTLAVCTKKNLILFSLNVDITKFNCDLNLKSNINETFTLNIIETPKLTKSFRELFSKYFHLNDIINTHDTKRGIKRKSKVSKSKDEQEIENSDLVLTKNTENYLFDASTYELMSSLNPFHQNIQTNISNDDESVKSKSMSGFKYCKWNKSTDYSVLATLTNDNQIILYDCERLNINKKIDENNIINLSELYLSVKKYHELVSVNSYADYVDILFDTLPICVEWSGRITRSSELLFVAFKSNNIAAFRLNYSNNLSNLVQVQFDSILFIDKISSKSDSYFDSDKFMRSKSQITAISFQSIKDNHFLLAIGLFNGNVLLKIFKINDQDKSGSIVSPASESLVCNMPDASNMKQIKIIKMKSCFLIISQKEYRLEFTIINIDESLKIKCHASPKYTKNGAHYKLVNFENLQNDEKSMNILLIYENEYYEIVQLRFDHENQTLDVNQLIDDKIKTNDSYKNIKQVFLSKNQYLFFQINDFSKSNLLKKKPFDFYLNIFQLKFDKIPIDNLINSINHKKLKNLSDFLWFFKSNLPSNSQNLIDIFGTINKKLKTAQNKQESCEDNTMSMVKLLRILNAYFVFYFENFNKLISNSNDQSINKDYKLITSTSIYRMSYRDLSLSLLKNSLVLLLDYSFSIGFKKLTDVEKLILIVKTDFALRKTFYGENEKEKRIIIWLNDSCIDDFKLDKNLTSILEKLLVDHKNKVNPKRELKLKPYLNCPICFKCLCFDKNTDINYIECEFGHKIKRCIKSLLPLSFKKHNKCRICESSWSLFTQDEIPNFLDYFNKEESLCLFCD